MVRSEASAPGSVPELLRAMVASDPGRPRLTWYGREGERVELSARTLENWVAKSANLLMEEFDAGPGTRIAVRLPAHWRTATWLLATWTVGGCAVVPADASATASTTASGPAPGPVPDVVVTADPGAALATGVDPASVVAVALPALATSYGGALPAGALDGAAEVRLRGDVVGPVVRPVPGDEAIVVTCADAVTYGDLLPAAQAAAREAGWPPRVRLLTAAGPDQALAGLLAPLVLDGSVVLHDPALDAGTLARVAVQERTTA
jgi:uncharacterized protein (TIGR03089 family)